MVFVAAVCGNRGRCFCSLGECRFRPVVTSVRKADKAASSAAARNAAAGVLEVTEDQVMDRIACWRIAANEIWSAVMADVSSRRRRARAAAARLFREAPALARTS